MLRLPLNPAQVTRVRRRSDPAPGSSARQTHPAPTKNFRIIDAPTRGQVVGARVLRVDRIDLLADEHAHTLRVASRSRCRGVAERVDLLLHARKEVVDQGLVSFRGREGTRFESEFSAARVAASSHSPIFSSPGPGKPLAALSRSPLACAQIA